MKTITNTIQKSAIAIVIGATLLFGIVATTQPAQAQIYSQLQQMINDLLAQVALLQAQLEEGQQNNASNTRDADSVLSNQNCVMFTKPMYLGATDRFTNGEVTRLQKFLTETGDYVYGESTGYYGPSTMAAVKRWQTRSGVVSYGTPQSTGYGLVGKLTREKMNEGCEVISVPDEVAETEEAIEVTAKITSISNLESPLVRGESTGVGNVGFSIAASSGDKAYGSGVINVVNGKWSHKVNADLKNDTYTLILYVGNKEYDRKKFTVNFKEDVEEEAEVSFEDSTPGELAGFEIVVTDNAKKSPLLKKAINHIEEELDEAVRLAPQLKTLRKDLKIYITDNQYQKGMMWYHESREWLVQNNLDPEMVGNVEVFDIKNLLDWNVPGDQPLALFHELVHVYHQRNYDWNENDYGDVGRAYKAAVESRKYNSVRYHTLNGPLMKAYAVTNKKEYFAEISEAYFNGNDYYPFNRKQLKEFDPIGYALMVKVWGGEENTGAVNQSSDSSSAQDDVDSQADHEPESEDIDTEAMLEPGKKYSALVVGAYQGTYPNGATRGFREHPQGEIDVYLAENVSAQENLLLVLTSYEPVKWNVSGPGAASVDRVFVTGLYEQEVTGLSVSVPIDSKTYNGGSKTYFIAFRNDSRFAALKGYLKEEYDADVLYSNIQYTLDKVNFDLAKSEADKKMVAGARTSSVEAQMYEVLVRIQEVLNKMK